MVPPRILVVDDTADVRKLLSRVLEAQGYDVLVACDGKAAIGACDQVHGEIDLLLTDIQMPGMNGIELAGSMIANYPKLRVLFISGQFEEPEIAVLSSKADFRFLRKPFVPQALL